MRTDAPEGEDKEDGDPKDSGPVVVMDQKKGKYLKVRGTQVCNYKITDSKCTLVKKCTSIMKDKNHFPPNIVAILRDRKKSWFFFNEKGKYCQRKDMDTKECTQWKSNAVLFGCKSKKATPALESLCSNPKISSGTNLSPYIYVFRGGKYWKFNNRPKAGQPLGDCVDGGKPAKQKWPGIRFPGGASYKKTSLVMVYKKKWSLWGPAKDSKNIIDKKIVENE